MEAGMQSTRNDGSALDADAFQRLYPAEFYKEFLSQGIRPDGRRFQEARETTVGMDVVSTADASALCRIGSSAAIAGVKLVLATPLEERPTEGRLEISVVETALTSHRSRRGEGDLGALLTKQVTTALLKSGAVKLSELCPSAGKVAWLAHLDVYILAADGAMLDAVLLAAVACLASLTIPVVPLTPQGTADRQLMATKAAERQPLRMAFLPSALTCAYINEECMVDPTANEESLAGACTSVVVAEGDTLLGVYKQGSRSELSTQQLQACVEAAMKRRSTVLQLLQQTLDGS